MSFAAKREEKQNTENDGQERAGCGGKSHGEECMRKVFGSEISAWNPYQNN